MTCIFTEEILESRTALWMSADGHMVLYATFNDTLVHEQKYPWYGAALDTDDPAKTYPEIRSVRYPKPGTNNPTVTLTVADIADPKHIRTRHLTPPKVIIEEGDYYFTSAQWVSLTEVCVVWLTRMQNLSVVSVCKSPMWYCQEVYRISSGLDGWVESAPSPLWSAGGGALVTLAPVRDGPAGLFRHIVRTEHNSHGPRALPLTHGSFDVVQLLAWDHANQHIYYLGIPEGKPGQQHLYRVSSEAPRPGSPQKLPYCVTCNSQPSPSINLEYYGSLASSGDSTWGDSDWDEELPPTSPSPSKKKKKKYPDGMPQNLPCLYHEAHFSPSSAYFVLECLGPGVPTFSLHKTALPDPRLIAHLENNTIVKEKLASIALPTPRTFSVQLSSGHAARVRLLLPPGLREDEVTKYPLVLKLVTERWSLDWGSLAAGAGAILASVDARGAGGRGLGAHHALHRRLGTVELQDQLEVAEYLRDSLHFIDARRVAVWGRAHGGFLAALALASTLNVFHCGIALTPIVRWRYYASAYAERYMGFPNATGNYRGYADADVTKQAAALHDKMLLLVHGTADNNVHVQQSMALARALADQGSMFRQQIYPDEGHSLEGVKRHLYRTMSAFLDDCFRKQFIALFRINLVSYSIRGIGQWYFFTIFFSPNCCNDCIVGRAVASVTGTDLGSIHGSGKVMLVFFRFFENFSVVSWGLKLCRGDANMLTPYYKGPIITQIKKSGCTLYSGLTCRNISLLGNIMKQVPIEKRCHNIFFFEQINKFEFEFEYFFFILLFFIFF
ncbi:hypothetical protein SFRURICE_017935 [Spodoptera frugiperda]|nr:hypothetical protein SFRURICE_017935 [Spodoptera frugiperda]